MKDPDSSNKVHRREKASGEKLWIHWLRRGYPENCCLCLYFLFSFISCGVCSFLGVIRERCM